MTRSPNVNGVFDDVALALLSSEKRLLEKEEKLAGPALPKLLANEVVAAVVFCSALENGEAILLAVVGETYAARALVELLRAPADEETEYVADFDGVGEALADCRCWIFLNLPSILPLLLSAEMGDAPRSDARLRRFELIGDSEAEEAAPAEPSVKVFKPDRRFADLISDVFGLEMMLLDRDRGRGGGRRVDWAAAEVFDCE